jgi:hypothetical protein
MAFFNPGSIADPFIGRVHGFLKVAIGHDLFRQVTTGTGNSCVYHCCGLDQASRRRKSATSRNVG